MSTYDAIAGDYHPAQRGLTNRFSGEKITQSFVCEEEGLVNLWKPEAGQQLTLYWLALNTPESNAAEVKVVVHLSPWEPYAWYLGAPGAFMHWEPIVGAVGASLEIETSAPEKLAVMFTLTEDYPRNE